MRLCALAVALCLAACSHPGAPPLCSPATTSSTTSFFGTQGEPATAIVELPLRCAADAGVRISASVLDPEGQPLPIDEVSPPHALPSADGGGAWSATLGATVRFTPVKPGDHHLVARFEPNLGLAQVDVHVAVDRTDARPVRVVDDVALGACTHVEMTPGGSVLCLVPFVAAWSGNARVQDFAAATVAAHADGVLWVVEDGGVVTRWLEVETADAGWTFQRESSHQLSTAQPRAALPTTRDVAIVSSIRDGELAVATDGGLRLTPIGGLTIDSVQLALACRDGDALTVLSGCCGRCTVSLDAGTGICNGDTTQASITCDPSGVWRKSGLELTVTPVAGAATTTSMHLPLYCGHLWTPAWTAWDTVDVLTLDGRWYVPGVRQGTLTLERYPGLAAEVISATSRWVTVRSPTGVRIYRR
jgi:hypothetical protein